MIEKIVKYLKSSNAFFRMSLQTGEGFAWDEFEDKEALLDYACDNLIVTIVNPAYLKIYDYPTGESPVGLKMADLICCKEAAKIILEDFYNAKGSEGVYFTKKRDDSELLLYGTYKIIYEGNKIVGHYGIEEDISRHLKQREIFRFN